MPSAVIEQNARAIRSALARSAYDRDECRFVNQSVEGYDWLVATNRGLYAVSLTGAKLVMHGWFFGICRDGEHIYLFDNCGLRDRTALLGRIVRLRYLDGKLCDPAVLVRGLHPNCHQLRVIDSLLCLVDTANQQILRFTLDGTPVDVKHPFPVAPPSDSSGAYRHINSIARIGERIAILCHNGKAEPERCSEIAWLNPDWTVAEMQSLAGHHCHDLVPDARGSIWHCASREGALASLDGGRVDITDSRMTRGLWTNGQIFAVGQCSFGPRQTRDDLGGFVSFFDSEFNRIADVTLGCGPTDIVSLPSGAHP